MQTRIDPTGGERLESVAQDWDRIRWLVRPWRRYGRYITEDLYPEDGGFRDCEPFD